MKKNFIYGIIAAAVILFSGCDKTSEDTECIVGSGEFFTSFAYLQDVQQESGELSEEELIATISPLFASAQEYLASNGYDYREDFDENDPNIILTALALVEYDFHFNKEQEVSISTKAPSFSTVVSCIFLGEEVKKVAKTGTMLIAKRVAKKIIARAVPYVGAAAAIISGGICLYENWNQN